MPLNTLSIIKTIDLTYPIRQIVFSPVEDKLKVFFVRTTSTIDVYSLDKRQNVRHVHRLNLADETETSPDIDYSMPFHIAPSHYFLYEYLFITSNGYVSMRDASKNTLLFEDMDEVHPELNYSTRWKSCCVAAKPLAAYIASHDMIELWDIQVICIIGS
jgi:hypothetical protein